LDDDAKGRIPELVFLFSEMHSRKIRLDESFSPLWDGDSAPAFKDYEEYIAAVNSAIGEFLQQCSSVLGEDKCARLFDIEDVKTFALLDAAYVR
jgi:hypothetical protein